MYQLIKTMGRHRDRPAILDQIDATNVTLFELSQHYTDIYFILKVKIYPEPRVLYFNKLDIDIQLNDHLSIVQYLNKYPDKTYPLDEKVPEFKRGEVYHWDVHSWNFHYEPVKLGFHPKARIPNEDKQDLYLYKKGLDHIHAGKHSLITINGFVHYHEYNKDGWYIHQGNNTRLKNQNKTHIGVLDFTQVGEVKLIPITSKMIRPATESSSLADNVYIDIGESVSGKTVGIVIGGYFHLHDHVYKQVSERLLKVDFNNIQWETLYYQLRHRIDLSSLPITKFTNDRVVGFELYHESTIKAFFTLSQSFIVVIDSPSISIIEEPVGSLGYPKKYESAIPPIYPLRIAEGRYPAYKATKNIDKWCISIEDNIIQYPVRYHKPQDTFHMIHNQPVAVNGETYATAHYVRFISDTPVVKYLDEEGNEQIKHHPKIIHEDLSDVYYSTINPIRF